MPIVRTQALMNSADSVEMEAENSTEAKRALDGVELWRVLAVAIVCYLVYLFAIFQATNFHELLRTFGDNSPYIAIAAAIKHWDFSQLHVKLFWGLPYVMVAVSSVTHLSNLNSLIAISMLASLITIALVYRLWGAWVAMGFVILSREWLERSLLGGAEPLFLSLLFGGLLAARRKKWELAALLCALATVVRPMGVFALVGIGIALLARRNYRKLAAAIAIGLAIGLLYIVPLKLYFGDSLANVKGYDKADWNSASPVTFPFFAIFHDALNSGATKLNLLRTGVWILFILFSAAIVAKHARAREYFKKCPVEATFWVLYLLFLFTYNSSWARAEFPRFAIPLVPFSIFAFEGWIPKNLWLFLAVGVLAALLSAAETAGFLNMLQVLRHAL